MLNKQQRELIIGLKQDGKRQQQIAQMIGCSQAAVSKWISKHKSGRTLETLPRTGRPTKLTERRLHGLRRKILIEVRATNKEYRSLSIKQLAEIVRKDVGKQYSLRHVERIMHRIGFSLITPRSSHLRYDQKKVDNFRDGFKKNFKGSTWILS